MAARVVHFGIDKCHRLNLLKRAGYAVDTCNSLVQLRHALQSEIDADVVMMSDDDGCVPSDAIALTHAESLIPVIFFPSSDRSEETAWFDLVVPTFTPPEDWLLDLAIMVVRSRAIRIRSQLMIEQSGPARQEEAAVCGTSRIEMGPSERQYERNPKIATSVRVGPDGFRTGRPANRDNCNSVFGEKAQASKSNSTGSMSGTSHLSRAWCIGCLV
jgi:hypothetical protein